MLRRTRSAMGGRWTAALTLACGQFPGTTVLPASDLEGEYGHSLTLERTRRGDTLGRARAEGGSIVQP